MQQHGRGRIPANLSVFRDRFSRKANKQNPGQPMAFTGWKLVSGRLPDDTIAQTVVLGPLIAPETVGPRSHAIPLTPDPTRQPTIGHGGDLVNGRIVIDDEGYFQIVDGQDDPRHSRLFHTGLDIPPFVRDKRAMRGVRARAMQQLRVEGIKPGYHGIFALELGSGHIVAEGHSVDVLCSSEIMELTDPTTRSLMKGLEDVPETRDIVAMVPKGGAILCGDLGGLTIHERDDKDGRWRIWDVTQDVTMQQLFQDYAEAERAMKRTAAAEAALKGEST